jgi:hypothetical protein
MEDVFDEYEDLINDIELTSLKSEETELNTNSETRGGKRSLRIARQTRDVFPIEVYIRC